MFVGDLQTSVSRCPFFPLLERKCLTVWNKSASLFIIVYLAQEQSSKWSRPRPQASGSAGPQRWLAAFAVAKFRDQSLLYYIQWAPRPQASFHVWKRQRVLAHGLHAERVVLVHSASMPLSMNICCVCAFLILCQRFHVMLSMSPVNESQALSGHYPVFIWCQKWQLCLYTGKTPQGLGQESSVWYIFVPNCFYRLPKIFHLPAGTKKTKWLNLTHYLWFDFKNTSTYCVLRSKINSQIRLNMIWNLWYRSLVK